MAQVYFPSELPKRFSKEEVYRADIANSHWADIPTVLDETHVLTSWDIIGDTLVSDRLSQTILDASRMIGRTHSAANILDSPYITGPDVKETEKMRKLLAEFEADPAYEKLIEPMQDVLRDSINLDWIKFSRRVTRLAKVANGRTPLYVVGPEIRGERTTEKYEPGFAGILKGIVTLKQDNAFTLEPVVRGIDGSLGLFPEGVTFSGLHAIHETTTYDKKFRMNREEEITDEEKAQADRDYEGWLDSDH